MDHEEHGRLASRAEGRWMSGDLGTGCAGVAKRATGRREVGGIRSGKSGDRMQSMVAGVD